MKIGIAGKKVGATLHYININKYIQTLKLEKNGIVEKGGSSTASCHGLTACAST